MRAGAHGEDWRLKMVVGSMMVMAPWRLDILVGKDFIGSAVRCSMAILEGKHLALLLEDSVVSRTVIALSNK